MIYSWIDFEKYFNSLIFVKKYYENWVNSSSSKANRYIKLLQMKNILHILFYIWWENMEKRVPCVWINRRPNRLTLAPKLIGNGTKKEPSWLAKPDCNFWTILLLSTTTITKADVCFFIFCCLCLCSFKRKLCSNSL